MDAKDAKIAALEAQIAAMSVTGAAGAAHTHAFVPKIKSPPKGKEAKVDAPKDEGKRTVKYQGVANWALIRSGTPMRQVCKGLAWTGVFMSPTCFRLMAIDGKEIAPFNYGSLNAFVKAHRDVLVKSEKFKTNAANAWTEAEYESDTHGWVKFDSIRKMDLKTPMQDAPVVAEASASAASASAALNKELDEGAEKPMSQESAPDDVEPEFEMEDITYNELHFQRKVGTSEIYSVEDNKFVGYLFVGGDGKMEWEWEMLKLGKFKNFRNDVVLLQADGTAKWGNQWNPVSKVFFPKTMPPDIDLVAVAEQLSATE